MTSPAKPQRVAIVASYAPSLTLFRGPLIREIAARGHAVLCAAPDIGPALARDLAGLGAETRAIPLSRTGLNPLSDAGTTRALTALFRDWHPDVVMGYTSKPAIYASLAARRAGVARVVPMITGLGYAFLDGGGISRAAVKWLMSTLYRRALAASDGVIFHNPDDASVFAKLGIVPADLPVTVTRGSGVDVGHYSREPMPPADAGLTYLMIARLVRYKGVSEYCEAARLAKQQGVSGRWLLVGPEETGPAGFPLRDLARYADAITYLGARDDVRPLLREAHVYVLPSYGEGMPRTVLEAMATGRPVITTHARGCRETVREGFNGLLVPPRNAVALSRAMVVLAEEKHRLAAMGDASRRLAVQEFDVARVNAVMLNALGLTID